MASELDADYAYNRLLQKLDELRDLIESDSRHSHRRSARHQSRKSDPNSGPATRKTHHQGTPREGDKAALPKGKKMSQRGVQDEVKAMPKTLPGNQMAAIYPQTARCQTSPDVSCRSSQQFIGGRLQRANHEEKVLQPQPTAHIDETRRKQQVLRQELTSQREQPSPPQRAAKSPRPSQESNQTALPKGGKTCQMVVQEEVMALPKTLPGTYHPALAQRPAQDLGSTHAASIGTKQQVIGGRLWEHNAYDKEKSKELKRSKATSIDHQALLSQHVLREQQSSYSHHVRHQQASQAGEGRPLQEVLRQQVTCQQEQPVPLQQVAQPVRPPQQEATLQDKQEPKLQLVSEEDLCLPTSENGSHCGNMEQDQKPRALKLPQPRVSLPSWENYKTAQPKRGKMSQLGVQEEVMALPKTSPGNQLATTNRPARDPESTYEVGWLQEPKALYKEKGLEQQQVSPTHEGRSLQGPSQQPTFQREQPLFQVAQPVRPERKERPCQRDPGMQLPLRRDLPPSTCNSGCSSGTFCGKELNQKTGPLQLQQANPWSVQESRSPTSIPPKDPVSGMMETQQHEIKNHQEYVLYPESYQQQTGPGQQPTCRTTDSQPPAYNLQSASMGFQSGQLPQPHKYQQWPNHHQTGCRSHPMVSRAVHPEQPSVWLHGPPEPERHHPELLPRTSTQAAPKSQMSVSHSQRHFGTPLHGHSSNADSCSESSKTEVHEVPAICPSESPGDSVISTTSSNKLLPSHHQIYNGPHPMASGTKHPEQPIVWLHHPSAPEQRHIQQPAASGGQQRSGNTQHQPGSHHCGQPSDSSSESSKGKVDPEDNLPGISPYKWTDGSISSGSSASETSVIQILLKAPEGPQVQMDQLNKATSIPRRSIQSDARVTDYHVTQQKADAEETLPVSSFGQEQQLSKMIKKN